MFLISISFLLFISYCVLDVEPRIQQNKWNTRGCKLGILQAPTQHSPIERHIGTYVIVQNI